MVGGLQCDMSYLLDVLKLLLGSYSGGFIVFWGAMLIAAAGTWILDFRYAERCAKLERTLFWAFGIAMILFAAWRPIGIARDDLQYLNIYDTVCPTLTCGKWIQGARDWGWYSLVGVLKSLVADPKVLLWLGAVGLLCKLLVIYNLVRRPLFVLLLYLSVYYELQDLTALRVSLSISVFMLGIWLVVKLNSWRYSVILLTCGFFHKQGYVAPLIIMGSILKPYRWLLTAFCIIPALLVFFGLYPQLQNFFSVNSWDFQNATVNQGLDLYLAAQQKGLYKESRNAPVVVYPLILFTLWLLLKAPSLNDKLHSIMAGCLAMGCLFLWGFASLPDAQVRFFEFFMVPTVLLAGVRRLDAFEVVGVVAVSGIFLLKYNVLHHLLV